jgi:hypothetical protein
MSVYRNVNKVTVSQRNNAFLKRRFRDRPCLLHKPYRANAKSGGVFAAHPFTTACDGIR